MKWIQLAVTALALLSAAPVVAGISSDYGFEQDRMTINRGDVFVVSSFDTQDGITVYDLTGVRLWEARFHAKILAWQVEEDFVLVFSKDRGGTSTYLTCIDRRNGKMVWQKP